MKHEKKHFTMGNKSSLLLRQEEIAQIQEDTGCEYSLCLVFFSTSFFTSDLNISCTLCRCPCKINFSLSLFRLNQSKAAKRVWFSSHISLFSSYTKSNWAFVFTFHIVGSHGLWNIVSWRLSSYSWTGHQSAVRSNCSRIFCGYQRRSREFPSIHACACPLPTHPQEYGQQSEQSWREIEV